jgi:hypothetical protein
MANSIYVIAFDIIDEDSNKRANLQLALINDFDDACHIEYSVWLIETPSDLGAIKSRMLRHLSHRDRLFISPVGSTIAVQALDDQGEDWVRAKGITVV